MAVKVKYPSRSNAFLGGEFFSEGIKEFADNEAGIKFANMFHLKYEVVEAVETVVEVKEEVKPVAPKKPAPKRKKSVKESGK